MKRLLVAVAAVAVLLSGCATSTTTPDLESVDGETTLELAASAIAPNDLVGIWHVSDADGTGDETWLRLDSSLLLGNPCGSAFGAWSARGDDFLAAMISYYPECGGSTDWLTAAAGFSRDENGDLILTGADGEALATLTAEGVPPDSFDWEPLTDYDIAQVELPDAAPLPAGATPVTDLVGTWLPVENASGRPASLTLRANGEWASKACNGEGGRWALGSDDSILTTSGVSTLIFCGEPIPPVGSWISGATTVGMVGNELTLYDTDGAVLGALVRA